jgi:glucose-1-phosphate thymidylyltransferase
MIARLVDTFARVLPGTLDEGVFVLGPDFGQTVRDELTSICIARGMTARFAIQEQALGTAHAVYAAHEFLSGDGIVVFADTLFDMEGIAEIGNADVVAWVKHVDDPSRFGVAVREGENIVAFVEKPKELISNEALIGIYYVRDLGALDAAIKYLIDNDITGVGREYQLTDAMDFMLKDGKVFHTATVTEWLDCGTIPALLDTTRIILGKEFGGATSVDAGIEATITNSVVLPPVYIGEGASISDAVVGPFVSVEAGATIRRSVVSDSIVFGNAVVSDIVLTSSLIGRHAEVTPAPQTLNVGDHSTVGDT